MFKKTCSATYITFLWLCGCSLSEYNQNWSFAAYNKWCRFVIGCSYDTHHCIMYDLLKWFPLNIRRHIHWLQFIFKCIHFNYPNYLRQNVILYSSPYHLRHSAYYFFTPLVQKVFGERHLGTRLQLIGIIYPQMCVLWLIFIGSRKDCFPVIALDDVYNYHFFFCVNIVVWYFVLIVVCFVLCFFIFV